MEEFIIKCENTAIVNGISKSTKLILDNYKKEKHNISLLDYGCGKLRNAKKLVDNKFKVSVLDIPQQLRKIKKEDLDLFEDIFSRESRTKISIIRKYDVILCSFVLNVIPQEDERIKVLENINEFLLDNGEAYIEVRGKNSIKGAINIEKYMDGYILGKGKVKTFQKPFSKDEIISLINKSKLKIKSTIVTGESIIIICQKGEKSIE